MRPTTQKINKGAVKKHEQHGRTAYLDTTKIERVQGVNLASSSGLCALAVLAVLNTQPHNANTRHREECQRLGL
eukprot:m.129528 g.129528  ORF g.129528 m.129528 type:complete len:74 (+) comp13890_c0_seq1:23-244(+)